MSRRIQRKNSGKKHDVMLCFLFVYFTILIYNMYEKEFCTYYN